MHDPSSSLSMHDLPAGKQLPEKIIVDLKMLIHQVSSCIILPSSRTFTASPSPRIHAHRSARCACK